MFQKEDATINERWWQLMLKVNVSSSGIGDDGAAAKKNLELIIRNSLIGREMAN